MAQSPYNPGYTVSLIGGYDSEHPVDGVQIENFQLGETKVRSADMLDLFTRHARDILFL